MLISIASLLMRQVTIDQDAIRMGSKASNQYWPLLLNNDVARLRLSDIKFIALLESQADVSGRGKRALLGDCLSICKDPHATGEPVP